jgi:Dolichyl-phosphate-mannose-protein mannosyltransferase
MTPRLRTGARTTPGRVAHGSAPLAALAVLTAFAFGLRVVGVDQTLDGDEYFTHAIVTDRGLSDVWHQVFHTSITPPLHYGLAWFAAQLGGDDTVLIRLPSLILGTAVVPVVFLTARRAGGTRAGLVAAGLMALSPLAIWYSDEGRAYATMMFLVAVSTLALLHAAEGERRGWWVIYALSTCAALWSHYTAVFVVLAQAGWGLWAYRERRKELLLSLAAVVVGYLPWLPGFVEQRKNQFGIEIIGAFADLSFGAVFELPLRTLVGHPFLLLTDSPGATGLLLVLVLAVLVLLATLRRGGALPKPRVSLRSAPGLMVIAALATPVGLLLYDAVSSTLYIPRNLTASLPALAASVALLLDRVAALVPPRLAAIATAAFVAVLAVDALESVVDDDQRRPPYREAAHYLDRVAGATDPVVDVPLNPGTEKRFRRTTLDLYFEEKHPLYTSGEVAAWQRLRSGRNVYVVAPELFISKEALEPLLGDLGPTSNGLWRRTRRLGGPDGRAILREVRRLPGIFPVIVSRYAGLVDGRLERTAGGETISWSFGRRVTVSPGVADGAVESVRPSSRALSISGWALDATRPQLVDWVLFFSRGRLLAVSPSGGLRQDLASTHGPAATLAGFERSLGDAPADPSMIRVFAVVGDRASELPLSSAAERSILDRSSGVKPRGTTRHEPSARRRTNSPSRDSS